MGPAQSWGDLFAEQPDVLHIIDVEQMYVDAVRAGAHPLRETLRHIRPVVGKPSTTQSTPSPRHSRKT